MKKRIVFVLALAAGLLAGGCSVLYRAEVQRGNVVTAEAMSQVRLGMTRRQVRFLLGSPLIQDPFHAERWDYVYLYEADDRPPVRTRLTLSFDDDRLIRVDGDFPAPESDYLTGGRLH